jgi:hypothetical protein
MAASPRHKPFTAVRSPRFTILLLRLFFGH